MAPRKETRAVSSTTARAADAVRALRENQERFTFAMELGSEWYWEQDAALRFTVLVGQGLRGARIDPAAFLGTHRWDHGVPHGDGGSWEPHRERLAARQPFDDFVYEIRTPGGTTLYGSTSGRPTFDARGTFTGYRGIGKDVTPRVLIERDLRGSAERFADLMELSAHWYWEQDAELRFTLVSPTLTPIGGVTPEDYLGRTHWDPALGIKLSPEEWRAHRATLEARQPFHSLQYKRVLPGGSTMHVSVSGRPLFDAAGAFIGYRGVGHDITDRKLAEEQVRYLASHDALTSLPNRTMFGELLKYAIQTGARYKRAFALLFVDLDRFKVINDTFGYEAGDVLLQQIATRLTETLRASDVVARLGGDEFAVLVQEVGDSQKAVTVARKIQAAIMEPLTLLGQECRVTASIGIAFHPLDAREEQALMKYADIALHRAKEQGTHTLQFYSEEINTHSLERLALEASLRRALERRELLLHYQAKLDLRSGAITGVEALVRWHHPERGILPPAQFIPLAEETGLIVPIGRWVLHAACTQHAEWQRQGLPPLGLAVNLSARQCADDSLLDDITSVLRDTAMDPRLLELEITESMVMQNPERTSRLLAAIKALGVRIAIDDFGTGYSSLAQIKRFPIDTLKVDQSFIRDIPQNAEDRAITQAIIAIGKTLKLNVVAEGVETREQQSFLEEHACDEMQGFYLSAPVTADRFLALVLRHREPRADGSVSTSS